jgi:hypothetical protein
MGSRGFTGTGESLERALHQACGDERGRAPTPLESALRDAADTPTDPRSLRPRSRVPSPPPAPASVPRPRLDTLPYDDTVLGDDDPPARDDTVRGADGALALAPDVGPSVRPTARSVPAPGRGRTNAVFMLAGAAIAGAAIAAAGTVATLGPAAHRARPALNATAPIAAMVVAADVAWREGDAELARSRYRAVVARFSASSFPARVRERAGE